jgi:hypothetical protein
MAVSLLADPALCQTKGLDIQIGNNGFTQPVSNGPRNALVAVDTEPAKFIDYYASLFAH